MLPRTLLSIPFLRTPTLTLLRRTLATPSSPPPPSSPSSSSLPPSIDQALRRSPVLMKLADDELFCKSFRTTGETMYSHGLNGAESIGEKFSHLFSSSPALQNAIAEMRASTRRLEVSDEDFQPVLSALFAQGGLQPFAPASSPSSSSPQQKKSSEEVEKKSGCGHNHAPGEKCS